MCYQRDLGRPWRCAHMVSSDLKKLTGQATHTLLFSKQMPWLLRQHSDLLASTAPGSLHLPECLLWAPSRDCVSVPAASHESWSGPALSAFDHRSSMIQGSCASRMLSVLLLQHCLQSPPDSLLLKTAPVLCLRRVRVGGLGLLH